MINVKRLVLFSVYQENMPKICNESNHELHINLFTRKGLSFKEVEGIYQGIKEKSFLMIVNNNDDFDYIKHTAFRLYKQECIICRDSQNNWYLLSRKGKETSFERGLWSDTETDNCTRIDGKYFVLR